MREDTHLRVMIANDEDATLRTIVERLVDTYQPSRIYLFGSHARGDATSDSDYDFLVVVPDTTPPARRDSSAGYRALRGTNRPPVDILVSTDEWFDQRVHRKASLPGIVAREGQLVYDAR